MAKPRQLSEKRGWAFAISVAIVKPLLLLFTKRRWVDGDKVPADGGCILVANHVSHLDPLTFAHFAYDHGRLPRFLAKSEVFAVPVVGTIVRSAGQIPVFRLSRDASQAFRAAVAAVEEGQCVVIYPEGTISRDPGLWPMTGKSGAARIALSTGAPVVPVAQWGANDILAPYAKKVRLLPRKTISMKAGDPVDLDDLRSGQLTPEVLREATDRIMDALTGLLADLRDEEPPAVRFDPKAAGVREIGNPNVDPSKRRGKRHTTREDRKRA
ncbi:MAG TPA: lysophospholipid acyltransferase family protein [Nocardioidaceae bacterium]|nr:lysophospholipid acyltransferase family protein [Nocardioidaceae bacterium]